MIIDDRNVKYYYNVRVKEAPKCPKILIVSYQPNWQAQELVRACIESIKKFTEKPYEIWIIDDFSPLDKIRWMAELDWINTAFVRTEPKTIGSYGHGVTMEVGAHLIDKETEYVVALHSDTVVCRNGWLTYLMSKLDDKVRASGFRFTTERVPEGILHVCGYLIDFQLYKKFNLSFMPKLPGYDTGDEIIHVFLKNGYGIFAARNTFDNPELINIIPEDDPVYNINSTRAFNDEGEIVYMHLGRGIRKTEGAYGDAKRTTSEDWITYVRKYLFGEADYDINKRKQTTSFTKKVLRKVKKILKKIKAKLS
jgi:glycosyltransferase involved in cell wall biosynthesis